MEKTVTGLIQARMGSTRLPGKVMLPLDNEPVLLHVIRRALAANNIDNIIVATSTETADDVIAQYAKRAGVKVFRGSESDVLDRMFRAATATSASTLVRITADCPLLSPETVDQVIEQLHNSNADYSTNVLERTFPRGLDTEAFTKESFEFIHRNATSPHHREHVTTYYREADSGFNRVSVTSDEVFDEPWMQDRSDLRLTLDEANDYELLREIYRTVAYDDILPIRDAITRIDEDDLYRINENIEQKQVPNVSEDPH